MNSSSESEQNSSPSLLPSKSKINKELINKKRKRKDEKRQKKIGSTEKKAEKRQKRKEYDKKQTRQNIKDKTYEKENIIELKEKEDNKKLVEMTKESSGSNDERKVDDGKSLKNSSENEKEESVQKAFEDMKESFNKKLNEISEQLNKKMNEKDAKINDLKEEFNKIMNDKDIAINGLNQKVEGLEKEVKEQRVKFDLMNEINNQTEIYNNIKHKALNSKINALINSFKILFIRKLSNLLFEKIVKKYKNDLAKTKEFFGQEHQFGIIVAKNDINNISKYKINILFDYLKFIKQFCSRIIHFRDFNKIYCQKEIFHELLDIYRGKKTEEKKGTLDTNDIINIIFKQKEVKSDEGSSIQKETQLEKIIREYIDEEKNKENKSMKEIEESDKKKQLDQKEKEEYNKQEEKEESEEEKELEEYEQCESFNEEKLKNIMSGEKSEKSLKVIDLLVKLKKKIKINKNNSRIKILKNTEINPKFIFSEWMNSFDTLPYKKSKTFESFVDIKNYGISLKKMGILIKELLPQEQFNFFVKDPDNFENMIETVIEQY